MFNNSFTTKKYLLRPVRRCKSGCKTVRVAPALTGTSYEN